jgi:predicted nucleic acid-binding protein
MAQRRSALMAFVVDASIVAAWFLPDETNDIADLALSRLENEDALAPDLLLHEMRNILLMAERRKRIIMEDVLTIFSRIENMPIDIITDRDSISIVRLARQHNLTAYDAAYLSLALHLKVPLVTADAKLAAAAKMENILLNG